MADAQDVYLKFEGLEGECTDYLHSGEDGWIQIKGFNFSFGLDDGTGAANTPATPATPAARGRGATPAPAPAPAARAASASSTGKGATLHFEKLSFSKNPEVASSNLIEDYCHNGETISQAVIEACRYGVGSTGDKIPFLRLIFENVHISKIGMQFSSEGMPTESISFDYDVVRMETMWTANETGERLNDRPCRAGWDKKENKPAS